VLAVAAPAAAAGLAAAVASAAAALTWLFASWSAAAGELDERPGSVLPWPVRPGSVLSVAAVGGGMAEPSALRGRGAGSDVMVSDLSAASSYQ
jgi:hypothetical protein